MWSCPIRFVLCSVSCVVAFGCGSGKTPIREGDPPEVVFLKKAGAEIKIHAAPGMENFEARDVDLTGVELTDEVFENLNAVSNALTLKLAGEHVIDEHIAKLGDIESLVTIDLTGASITDEAIRHLVATMPHLSSLNLSSTQVTIEGIRELQKLKLNGLLLNFVPIGDDAVDEIVKMKSLAMLAVAETNISSAGKNRLKSALPGRFIMVGK